ncbi:MAG: response regulator transcription factor [Dehalococcoidia bacterium]
MGIKVLLVDDEEDVLELVGATLGNDDRFQVLVARDGDEALAIAHREQLDLIFLDIMMPGKDGIQVCYELKRRSTGGKTKIVMLTALAQELDQRRAMEVGADDYFTKPFSPTTLLEKLEEVLSPAAD